MNLDHYDLYPGTENFYYEFYSEGPKGYIRKLIQFHMLQDSPDIIYNLGFGDWVDEKAVLGYCKTAFHYQYGSGVNSLNNAVKKGWLVVDDKAKPKRYRRKV